ncbi:MAG TPA: FAD-linked oxidase C-terminal domain-containing protein, partial [Thermomicrobiales bacterium]|nr:FAD-linked oxidase C-terminal domain-containing protein [Thermomicrobiales bacterium]
MAHRLDGGSNARRCCWRRVAWTVAMLVALSGAGMAPRAAAQDAPPGPTAQDATPAPFVQEPITPAQPGFDGIRAAQDGQLVTYSIWVNLPPVLVTTPDGGAWAFFTARARTDESSASNQLFAARFDPKAHVWQPAATIPGNDVQFGPAAVVDAKGAVHLIYSARPSESATSNSTLMYTVNRDGRTWETPQPVAPDPNAGMQVMADLAIDSVGVLHAIWRDQRSGNASVSPNDQSDGDLFVSDFAKGAWSKPVQLTGLNGATDFVAWPRIECEPSAIELMDRMLINLTRSQPGYRRQIAMIQGDPAAVLAVEFYGDDETDLERQAQRLEQHLAAKGVRLMAAPLRLLDPARQADVWSVRKAGLGLLMSVKGDHKPIPAIEDVSVPAPHLAEYVEAVEELVAAHGTTAAYYAHASAGCLHIRPLINLKTVQGVQAMTDIAHAAAELAHRFGGVMSGEHGDGLQRSELNPTIFGPELYEAMREFKRIWDPRGL